VLFVDKPVAIPQSYFKVTLLFAVKEDKKAAFAKLLATAFGGANCIVGTHASATCIFLKIVNRKEAFDTEPAFKSWDKADRVHLKSAQFM